MARDYTINAICSARRSRDILLLLALCLLLCILLLCLLLLIDLPLLCVGFLLLNSREDIVGFEVFRVVLADSTIFHLLKFLGDISEGQCGGGVVMLRWE